MCSNTLGKGLWAGLLGCALALAACSGGEQAAQKNTTAGAPVAGLSAGGPGASANVSISPPGAASPPSASAGAGASSPGLGGSTVSAGGGASVAGSGSGATAASGGTTNAAGATATALGSLVPTPMSQDFYGSLAQAVPGDVLMVRDPQGVVCGRFVVRRAGEYGFVHVYADDPLTPNADEGASAGDLLRFELNGQPLLVLAGDPHWVADGMRVRVDLSP